MSEYSDRNKLTMHLHAEVIPNIPVGRNRNGQQNNQQQNEHKANESLAKKRRLMVQKTSLL